MINLTKLSDAQITLNSDLIETIEEVPETVLTLTNGKKILVKESRQEVVNLVKCYKKELFSQYNPIYENNN
ncbi:MAG: flagellar FlbD family protein [Anaerocolumna sp.]|jgi:flagellar protein FlbD|nr:flagellar FlbD family protein [Anaerocolumna sp.]